MTSLLRFLVQLEDVPRSFEIDGVSVDDHLVFSGVVRDAVHIFHEVAMGSKRIDDKVDVYHVGLEDGRRVEVVLLEQFASLRCQLT
ncbi:hypothetical protein P8936_16855 [Edaphobacter paludis]|uniref:Uncharacterized protein n=1 Tax=Edaphobacter paludis TaxID=3035702 RepID=A0AAU7D922_9BACT